MGRPPVSSRPESAAQRPGQRPGTATNTRPSVGSRIVRAALFALPKGSWFTQLLKKQSVCESLIRREKHQNVE